MNKKLFFRKFFCCFVTTIFFSFPTMVSASNFGQIGSTNGFESNYGMLENAGNVFGGSAVGDYNFGSQGNYSGLGSNYNPFSNFGIDYSGNSFNDYSNLWGMSSNYSDLIGAGSNYKELINPGTRENYNKNYENKNFKEIFDEIGKKENKEEDKAAFNELSELLENVDENKPIVESKFNIMNGAFNVREKNKESDLVTIISNLLINESISANPFDSTSNLLDSIKSSLGNVIDGKISFESLKPDVVVKDMKATTAGKLLGKENEVKLCGKIYFAETDKKGKPTSEKWVVLVHGFMMNGQAIADVLGEMYLEKGINVLAPDLRGFGDSEGKVAMGYMESLDIWDWLTYLNKNYDCEEIFVHGVSLGGATTIFVSGLEIDGKTMKDQNVIGLIEDCGYGSMTGIITDMISLGGDTELIDSLLGDLIKTAIIDLVGVGLTEKNFDEYQDGLKSLENCTLPLMIVHGTFDTAVPVSNSEKVYKTAMKNNKIPYVQKYLAEGGSHAFITMGINKNEYIAHLENFINVSENVAKGKKVEKEANFTTENIEKDEIIDILITTLKLFGNLLIGNL